MKKFFLNIAVSLLLIFVLSCGDNIVNNPVITFPDSLVSYHNHVQPFIKQVCALQGCHATYNPQKDVILSEWEFIISTYNGAMVIPGKPDASVLNQMLEYRLPHDPMLNWNAKDNQVKGVRRWVLEGALNN